MKAEFKKKNVTLRTGEPVILRPLVRKDAAALLAFYRALPEEDRKYLDDDVTREDWVDRFIERVDYDAQIPIVAEMNGGIVGHATLIRARFGWMAHVGRIRIAIAHDHQRKGLGTLLLRELMKIAVSVGLEKMTAQVMDNQAGPRHAFEKLGFKVEATLGGMVKDIYGKRRNLVVMANDVSHIWQAMDALVSDEEPTRESL
jgi:L-amino acid N-acyltransferase YncA